MGGNLAPGAITLVLTNDYEMKIDTIWNDYKVPLDRIETKIGSCFSLSNNSVLIGDNVNAVKISGNVDIWKGSDIISECILKLGVYHNNVRTIAKESNSSKNGGLIDLSISPFIASVQKGDTIVMNATLGSIDTVTLMGRSTNTYLTVEKIY